MKIVVPFAYNESEKGVEYEADLRDSILSQAGLGDRFDVSMVFVLQEKGGKVHQVQDWGDVPRETVVMKADGFDYPTTFHQAEDGFKKCLDAEYCMYMTGNDMLAPLWMASAIHRMQELSAKVVYADTLMMTPDKKPLQCNKPAEEFLPFKFFAKRDDKISNPVPDICLIDCSILEVVPFESKYKRASFAIWWYRIWERFGHLAFAYVNTIGCLYCPHSDHAADNEEWVGEGYKILNAWLETRPWRKYTAYAGF